LEPGRPGDGGFRSTSIPVWVEAKFLSVSVKYSAERRQMI
jgi:hypothetical protein